MVDPLGYKFLLKIKCLASKEQFGYKRIFYCNLWTNPFAKSTKTLILRIKNIYTESLLPALPQSATSEPWNLRMCHASLVHLKPQIVSVFI